ncbi:MAG: ACP S-malonyltransferase [Caldilineaceae bacterium]|nr:ACP S-malonyltransferase [Phycisphaerales bacterium]MCB0059207.1 ACP S-malonyltransferase [Caldilineaceae bacterium]
MSSDQPIILCPGQGAQAIGMGKAWFDASPDAARTFGAADEQLGDRFGAPLSQICFEGPAERLNRTDVAQPALFVCAVASFQALFNDTEPGDLAATAGLSLGEYTALHLAGAISFADALELVALRGRAMQDAAEASRGSMVALVGATEDQAKELCDRARERGVLVPANLNAPGQVVVSGDADACARAVTVAAEMSLRAAPLEVAGAFHSPLMAPAAERLAEALEKTSIDPPRCLVMSNVTGQPHVSEGDEVAALIRQRLVEQLTHPVRWSDDCQWLAANAEGAWHELAPGKVLSGLMRRINRETKVTSHDAPES